MTGNLQDHLDSLLYPDDFVRTSSVEQLRSAWAALSSSQRDRLDDFNPDALLHQSNGVEDEPELLKWYNAGTLDVGEMQDPWDALVGRESERKETVDVLEWLKTSLTPSQATYVYSLLQNPNLSEATCSSQIFDEVFSSNYTHFDEVAAIISRRPLVLSQSNQSQLVQKDHENGVVGALPKSGPSPMTGSQRALKDARKARKREAEMETEDGWDPQDAARRHAEEVMANAERGLFTSERAPLIEEERYPHVYTSSAGWSGGATLSFLGTKYALPAGTERVQHEGYEEVIIPATKRQPPPLPGERLIQISEFPPSFRGCFPGYKSLNRLQSLVYPRAFKNSANLLVCAPTGAGKTDVALLSILRAIQQHGRPYVDKEGRPRLGSKEWKIVYVAPMKALASEVVEKMRKRLGGLGVKVRELTGDMQMTRQEIGETQMIVTTPEKWDVVTRKPSFATHVAGGGKEEEIVAQVKLLIIDEVHLLNDDRGAVIETIVARTLRLVETTQSLIRIVGLSATLPNYVDVAKFLRVNLREDMFYFDGSFRPVPLEQHFIGVKGKSGSQVLQNNMDVATFDQVARLVKEGHQVMVFVHARKETVKTAQMLRDKVLLEEESIMEVLDPESHPKYNMFRREAQASRNKELKELMAIGFGIHHAGMLRGDRNLSERMFESGLTKVLCCTSTLAWGVNLPAYAVVIKGTQIYDSSKGSNIDLSILDVLQIFGRAGRPQYESQGVGYICTSQDKLDHYVTAVTQQIPIESKFIAGLVDALNAEISLGNVATVDEGVRWIGYTYLFVRMQKNPMIYGMEMGDDRHLGSKRWELISVAARKLALAQMIIFDEDLGTLTPTEIGKIASRYYIRHASIELFNNSFRPNLSEADMLMILSSSVEFNQILIRESEVPDLKKLLAECPCQVQGGTDTSQGKINILLQSYISKIYIEDFALVSDTSYVAQNAGRIARALLDIAIHRKWGVATLVCSSMNKAIEKRMWPFDQPLIQCDGLSQDLLYNIQQWADDLTVKEISEASPAEFGKLIHLNERQGNAAVQAAKRFPKLKISVDIRPLTSDVLQLHFNLRKDFDWSEKVHKSVEGFWLWVEDPESNILRLQHILVRQQTVSIQQEFNLFFDSMPPSITVRLISDRWVGNDQEQLINLVNVRIPPPSPPPDLLLNLPLLPMTVLKHKHLISHYEKDMHAFNPIQTQVFHTMVESECNVLLAAPEIKTRMVLCELAICSHFARNPKSRILLLASRKHAAKIIASRLQKILHSSNIDIRLVSQITELSSLSGVVVYIPTSLNQTPAPDNTAFDLIVATELQALSPEYEMTVAQLRRIYPNSRFVGFSTPLADVTDIAQFLGCKPVNTFSFHSSTSSESLAVNFVTYTQQHSTGLLRSMIKPVYLHIRQPTKPSCLCVVPSVNQTKVLLKEMVTLCASDIEKGPLYSIAAQEMIGLSEYVSDVDLSESLIQGIGIVHGGLKVYERRLVLELFQSGVIRVLFIAKDEGWNLFNVSADKVILLGAQYWVENVDSGRRLVDYSLTDLLQLQSFAHPRTGRESEFIVMCQSEQAEIYSRFLLEGLPLESKLELKGRFMDELFRYLGEEVKNAQDAMDYFSWTFLFVRTAHNPSYYFPRDDFDKENSENWFQARLVDKILNRFQQLGIVRLSGSSSREIQLTNFGRAVRDSRVTFDNIQNLKAADVKFVLSSVPPQNEQNDELYAKFLPDLKKLYQRLSRSFKDMLSVQVEDGDEAFGKCGRKILVISYLAASRFATASELEREQISILLTLI